MFSLFGAAFALSAMSSRTTAMILLSFAVAHAPLLLHPHTYFCDLKNKTASLFGQKIYGVIFVIDACILA